MPFIQRITKLTKEQLELVNGWTMLMNADSKKFFIHVLICQKSKWLAGGYRKWDGVPVPRETAIHPLLRKYKWDFVKKFMSRAPYSKEEGICYRYKIHHEYIEEFIKAGEGHYLSIKKLKDEPLYDLCGVRVGKLVKPFSENPTTPIDIREGVEWLRREKDWYENKQGITQAQRSAAKRRYLHNLCCFQAIMNRMVSIDWKDCMGEYSQELREPHKGLRKYEVGGGLQGASTNFREYLLLRSNVVNYDVVKCHAKIAHEEMKKLGIINPFDEMILNGAVKIPEGCQLAESSIKKAMLAVLNGARLTTKLRAQSTLPQIIDKEDKATVGEQDWYQQQQLNILVEHLRPVAEAVRKFATKIPAHEKIKKVSAFLQEKEAVALAHLKSLACNDQHDGVLVRAEDVWKINHELSGYLKVVPKAISKAEAETESSPRPVVAGQGVRALFAMLGGPAPGGSKNTHTSSDPDNNGSTGIAFC